VLWHLRNNVNVAETARRLDLTAAQVHAALSYYYDHTAEIEDEIAKEQALIKETQATQSTRRRIRATNRSPCLFTAKPYAVSCRDHALHVLSPARLVYASLPCVISPTPETSNPRTTQLGVGA